MGNGGTSQHWLRSVPQLRRDFPTKSTVEFFSDHRYLNDQGCYVTDILSSDTMFNASKFLNPDKCKEMCKEKGIRYAAISFQNDVGLNTYM